MSDDDKIHAHLTGLPDGELMSDACARTVALQWHGGQASALCALATSGAITDDVAAEVGTEVTYYRGVRDHQPAHFDDDDRRNLHALEALLTYVTTHGQRGPVAGWADLRL